MTHSPLDDRDRIAPLPGCRRTGATWLALIALLGSTLLPAALSILVLNEPDRGIALCREWPVDAPGKVKPGLLVQHCPFCTMAAAPLARPSILIPGEVAKEVQLRLTTTVSITPTGHGRMRARAPPSVG